MCEGNGTSLWALAIVGRLFSETQFPEENVWAVVYENIYAIIDQ